MLGLQVINLEKKKAKKTGQNKLYLNNKHYD